MIENNEPFEITNEDLYEFPLNDEGTIALIYNKNYDCWYAMNYAWDIDDDLIIILDQSENIEFEPDIMLWGYTLSKTTFEECKHLVNTN